MNKKTFAALNLLVLTFQLGGTALAQGRSSTEVVRAIQENVLKEELRKCFLEHEYSQMKLATQSILQASPSLLSYLEKIEAQRCVNVIEKARQFGMSDKAIEEAIKERYVKPRSDFNLPKKLFEQKTVNGEGGAHTGVIQN